MNLVATKPDGTRVPLTNAASGGYIGHEWSQHDANTGKPTDGYPCILVVSNYSSGDSAFLIAPPAAPVYLETEYE